ncbi:alternate-type signal peptide domain-containing protein [Leucobacter sp. UT-8R-CII-1-4]|uniref:alternate-type signal peptide domain-containing protein n=1 Tax=Leucobacter sp. UT-8R-CII-1-4 TaxID=3040075 RepID=UPI0024A904DA|nr:alternate-type signal peptide domain-containing protein [Leucobacter sp. UT-8R-CII-1-4]MDI6023914.1 alternate-type signal peptide domain-containing protein [Leucobacter sp. UT-8R-CII-1-4]
MTKTKRGHAAARGALAAAIATALLLGGYGGFSLWQDSVTGGINDNIRTGKLRILEVEDGVWSFAFNDTDMTGDGIPDEEQPIVLADWKASPGDELVYRTYATVLVCGDDMLGEFSIDQSSYTVNDPALQGLVTVAVDDANLTVYPDPEPQRVPIKVTVKFSELIAGLDGQDLADVIDLSQLKFQLDQVQAPTSPSGP